MQYDLFGNSVGRTASQKRQTRFYRIRSSPWFVFTVVNMAALTDSMFFGLIVPFVPNILRDRTGVPDEELQLWNSVLVGVYGAAIFVGSPDHARSRRGPLLLGYMALACSTLLLHKGPTLAILVLGRILQGLSAAAVCSVGFAMLYDSFGNGGVGGALGWVSAALDAGGFLGPGIAGALYEAGGEDTVFYSAYAFIAIDAALGILVIAADQKQKEQDENSVSSSDDSRLSTDSDSSEELLMLRDIKMRREPEYVPLPKSPAVEYRFSEDSMAPSEDQTDTDGTTPLKKGSSGVSSFIQLLLMPRLFVAVSGWLVVGIFETAFDSVLPLFVQELFNWPIVGAGLVFIPFYLPSILLSPLCGYVTDRVRNTPRILAAGGFFLCGPSFILLGCVDDDTVEKQILLCVLLTLIGVGTAFSGPPLLREVGVVVEEAEQSSPPGAFGPKGATARAYGVHNAAFAIGNLLGPILAGAFKASLGWAAMGWFFGVLSLVSGVVVLVCLEGYIGNASWTAAAAARTKKKPTGGSGPDVEQQQLLMTEV